MPEATPAEQTDVKDVVARLQGVACDRQPFTPEHAECICRLANKAAAEIERLSRELEEAQRVLRPFSNAWERFRCAFSAREFAVLNLNPEVIDGVTWADIRSAYVLLEQAPLSPKTEDGLSTRSERE